MTISENDGDRQKRSNDINPKLKKFDPKLAFDLADQMKDLDEESIRKIRSGMYTVGQKIKKSPDKKTREIK